MASRPALFAALLLAAAQATRSAPHNPTPTPAPKAAERANVTVDLDWRELLPEPERAHFSPVAPPPVHDSRGEGGPPAVQVQDFSINKSLDGLEVRLPGFIVPLEELNGGALGDFLLVPYFGACIHVPPPPPNQMVYVHASAHLTVDSIYEAYWITGRLRVQTQTTRLGVAAYELSAERVELYKY